MFLFITLLTALILGDVFVSGLIVTKVLGPQWVELGGEADLECQYLLEGEKLYSIKWYQGDTEIYRYTPYSSRMQTKFDNEFLIVDMSQSREGRVHVSNVSVGADGPFRCEVSADAPAFFTDYGAINIRVVALPVGGPTIVGVEPIYRAEEWVSVTCHTGPARPSPKLTFTLNGKQPNPDWIKPQVDTATSGGLHRSAVQMRFLLHNYTMQDLMIMGETRLRCLATIPTLYEASVDESLSTRPPVLRATGYIAGEAMERECCWITILSGLLVSLLTRR